MSKTHSIGWRRRLVFQLVLIALTLLAIEGIVRYAACKGVLNIRVYPTISRSRPIRFLGDLNPHFGAWHRPNASTTVKTPNGNIQHTSNAHGMRDRPRELKSKASERVVVLGDSFIEGMGVEATNRLTDLLEQWTGVEFLNFGTSGGFGSIQEWQLYEHLALSFDHSRVFLFLLPDNDFSDNETPDPSSDRYRPFLQKQDGLYREAYPFPFDQVQARRQDLPWGRRLRHRIYNHWYTLGVLNDLSFAKAKKSLRPSSYDVYSEEDLEKLLFTYAQIADLARPRPLTIFIIPRDTDFAAQEAGRNEGRIVDALRAFAAQREGIRIVDLMPGFLACMKERRHSFRPFFLGYDAHWSPYGHQVAAKIVLENQPDLRRAGP